MKKVAVVGSGPAGVVSAYVLLKRGLQVHMYDVGIQADYKLDDIVGSLDHFNRWQR